MSFGLALPGVFRFFKTFMVHGLLEQQALDTVNHPLNVEIHQECLADVQQAQVRQRLRLVNWQDAFDGLQFDDEFAPDHEIDPIAAIQGHALVRDGEWHLPDEAEACMVPLLLAAVRSFLPSPAGAGWGRCPVC
jgi:hypothetical protein